MVRKCGHCDGQLGEKYHEVQVNGTHYYFCPDQYAFGAPDCLTKFLREYKKNGREVRQYRVISFSH